MLYVICAPPGESVLLPGLTGIERKRSSYNLLTKALQLYG